MSGRLTAATLRDWAAELDAVGKRIASQFPRIEPRRRALGYLSLLLSDVERKNGWQMAERLGDANPFAVQHLLGRAVWDADAVRDELQRYVVEHLGDADGVLVVDETGFLKKGDKSVGVARQYSGTAGRIENCQIGVFLGYATRHGSALIDRAVYLPKEWADDVERRRAAQVPESVEFATKPVLAKWMIERALAAGVPAQWVTADTVYGSDYKFRMALETKGLGYVIAVRSDFAVWAGFRQVRVKTLLDEVPADAWCRLSCGDGSKGPRRYDWAIVRTNSSEPRMYSRWLLIRRSIADPGDVAYFACGGPPNTTLEELVRIAGRRWTIEEDFELAKGDCGLDEYEVRSWDGWHRHVTLSLWALAVVTVIRSRALRASAKKRGLAIDPSQRAGGAEAAVACRVGRHRFGASCVGLVRLATPSPVLGQILPLQATPRPTAQRRFKAVGLASTSTCHEVTTWPTQRKSAIDHFITCTDRTCAIQHYWNHHAVGSSQHRHFRVRDSEGCLPVPAKTGADGHRQTLLLTPLCLCGRS